MNVIYALTKPIIKPALLKHQELIHFKIRYDCDVCKKDFLDRRKH